MNNGTYYFHKFLKIVTSARYVTATGLFSRDREARKTVTPPPKAC